MSYEPLEYLADQIKAQIGYISDSLAEGSAKDYAEYQRAVGKVQGLLTAQSIITDLAKRLETSDE